MRKLVNYCLLGVFIIICLDWLGGLVLDYFRSNANSGPTAIQEDIYKRKEFEVIIMGSSRACHHYIPTLMEKELQMTVANAGKEGNGIITMYGIAEMILQRYTPKVIIYDVTPEYDYLHYSEDGNLTRYLTPLLPYSKDKGVKKVIDKISRTECVKTLSNLYRYNSVIPTVIHDYLKNESDTLRGYLPLYGVLSQVQGRTMSNTDYYMNPTKTDFLQYFVSVCKDKGITLVFAASPKFGVESSDVFEWIHKLATENHIPLINFYTDSLFVNNPNYFNDAVHLNNEGAIIFTSKVCNVLRSIVAEQ